MLLQSNQTEPCQTEPAHLIQLSWHGTEQLLLEQHIKIYFSNLTTKRKVNITMAMLVNWTRKETFKLISLWSKDVIQEQLEGCQRNSLVYHKIANDPGEAGYSRSLERRRDTIKKRKGNMKISVIKERRQVKGGSLNGNFSMQ